MTTFFERPASEQEIIRKACDFEVEAIATLSNEENPYYHDILAMKDGKTVWEAINEYVETWPPKIRV